MRDSLIGRTLPDLSLQATDGIAVNPRRLAGTSVIFCYPWTGRPGLPNPTDWDTIPGAHGSTPQAEGYATAFEKFSAFSTRVFGLSLQSADYQREFAIRCRLPFALLSDATQEFSRALELPDFTTGGVTYLRRLTLMARDGVVLGVRYPVPDPAGDAAAVLDLLASR
jgi:peroxiredoxin